MIDTTPLGELNRTMLAAEKEGLVSETEYATYKALLECAEALAWIEEHDREFGAIEDAETQLVRIQERARAALAKLQGEAK